MADFKMNLDGVAPASVSQYVAPGEYAAKISAAEVDTDTAYGNAVRFHFQITSEPLNRDLKADEENPIGKRVNTLMFIPDGTMVEKTGEMVKKGKKKTGWDENFVSLMASKWVSLLNAAGFDAKNGIDARKAANKMVGTEMVVIVQDSKRTKPTDPVYSNVNGTLPMPAEMPTKSAPADADSSDDEGDEFDLDDLS